MSLTVSQTKKVQGMGEMVLLGWPRA